MMNKWIWMGHAGHLCVGSQCRFHLNTYVNGYIISTVGEWDPDEGVKRINLEVRIKWHPEEEAQINAILSTRGDEFHWMYHKYYGYDEIGLGRTYETMVFSAKPNSEKDYMCCPFIADTMVIEDANGYNDASSATEGHYQMCKKYETFKKDDDDEE